MAPKKSSKPLNDVVFILLMLVLSGREGISAPPARTVVAIPVVGSYDELVTAIRQTKAQSRVRVEALVEAEKVREAWEIGKLIEMHILQNKPRADYDKRVVQRLAKDLGASATEIWYMLEFARTYPILPQAGELSWSHYRELLSLNDSKEREEVSTQAVREGWGRDRLREEVHRRQAARQSTVENQPAETILTATPGRPGIYRVVKAHYGKEPNQLVLDLGFSNYYRPPGKFPFKEGDIVELKKGKLKKLEIASGKSAPRNDGVVTENLFTYSASVIQVIDGDTFTAAVELGFGFTTVQTLRLRALDAPEIESAEGREAKAFLERTLPRGSNILIRTHRSDKYDRYLADVFVHGEYVNQRLVDEGFAVPLGNGVGE